MSMREDLTIRELAERVMQIVGYEGKTVFDTTRPDGTPRKLLDISTMEGFGCSAKTSLIEGIVSAYADFLEWEA